MPIDRTTLSLLLAGGLALIGCFSSPPRQFPVYGWQPAQTETFVLAPGGGTAYVTQASNTKPRSVRYDIRATQPVNVAVGDVPEDGSDPTLDCRVSNVLQSQQSCPVPGGGARAAIVVGDSRSATSAGDALGAAALAYLGAKQPLQTATAENRVTVTFYAWQCVRNCPRQ